MSSVILEQDLQRSSQHLSDLYHSVLTNCQIRPDCMQGVDCNEQVRRQEHSRVHPIACSGCW